MQGDAIHHGRHTEFTHTVMNVIAARLSGRNRLRALPQGQVGTRQVGTATQQFGNDRSESVQRHLAGLTGGYFRPFSL